jgi:hypothetical protein
MDVDHQVGGVEEAAKKVLEADREFVMGHVYKLFAEVSADNNKAVYKTQELKKKYLIYKKSARGRVCQSGRKRH